MQKVIKKKAVGDEKFTSRFAFASLVATEEIRKYKKITKENCFPKRPGIGDFLAKDYKNVLGKKVIRTVKKNTLIKKGFDVKKYFNRHRKKSRF